MIMFLQLLRYSYSSCQIYHKIALWSNKQTYKGTGKNLYGISLSATVARNSYS